MQIIRNIPGVLPEPCVATIGFFDGVHMGHRFLIEQVRELAAARGLRSALITFPIHPRKVMNADYRPELLTTSEEKLALLEETGVDYCFMLDFTREVSHLTAHEFMSDILRDRYRVQTLVIGYDHRFGHNRSEGFEDYCRYGSEMGIEVIRARACVCDDLHISSSVIRKMLHQGEVDRAARCLGYDYFLDGTVVSGYQVGRKIGFPTANLSVDDPDKLVPADGVYEGLVLVDDTVWPAAVNVGLPPTYADDAASAHLEANLIGYTGDLYGASVSLAFTRWLRPSRVFDSLDELIATVEGNIDDIRHNLGEQGVSIRD